jgi:hypothetical protein
MKTPMQTLHPSNEQLSSHADLSARVRELLRERFDSYCAIQSISRATGGEIYIFGGTLRRAMFGDKLSGDVDIMVPNGDNRAFELLDSLKVPFVLNSQNLHRYRWNSLQIDLFQPREFFHGFQNVEAALQFFDLRINALALHICSGRILDPFDIVSARPILDPGIIWSTWIALPAFRVVILAIRLMKIMHELPGLTISVGDAYRLRKEVVPLIRDIEWTEVQQRFPRGKDIFLRLFTKKVLNRVRTAQNDGHSGECRTFRGDAP